MQEESSFCEQKEAKKLCQLGVLHISMVGMPHWNKSFPDYAPSSAIPSSSR